MQLPSVSRQQLLVAKVRNLELSWTEMPANFGEAVFGDCL
jgi:hypothetical protein